VYGDRKTGSKPQFRAVSFWISEEDLTELKAPSREKGIGHTTLVRMWVREKLQAYRSRKGRPSL